MKKNTHALNKNVFSNRQKLCGQQVVRQYTQKNGGGWIGFEGLGLGFGFLGDGRMHVVVSFIEYIQGIVFCVSFSHSIDALNMNTPTNMFVNKHLKYTLGLLSFHNCWYILKDIERDNSKAVKTLWFSLIANLL